MEARARSRAQQAQRTLDGRVQRRRRHQEIGHGRAEKGRLDGDESRAAPGGAAIHQRGQSLEPALAMGDDHRGPRILAKHLGDALRVVGHRGRRRQPDDGDLGAESRRSQAAWDFM